jgi:hypothetical protein
MVPTLSLSDRRRKGPFASTRDRFATRDVWIVRARRRCRSRVSGFKLRLVMMQCLWSRWRHGARRDVPAVAMGLVLGSCAPATNPLSLTGPRFEGRYAPLPGGRVS